MFLNRLFCTESWANRLFWAFKRKGSSRLPSLISHLCRKSDFFNVCTCTTSLKTPPLYTFSRTNTNFDVHLLFLYRDPSLTTFKPHIHPSYTRSLQPNQPLFLLVKNVIPCTLQTQTHTTQRYSPFIHDNKYSRDNKRRHHDFNGNEMQRTKQRQCI